MLFIPAYIQGNVYQKLLADALSKEDIAVKFGASTVRLFSVLRSARETWKPDIIHLHWTHSFILGNNKMKTIMKSLSFIFELLSLRLLGVKIVWTVHNITSHEGKYKYLELFFCRLVARVCNQIIAHSPSAKSDILNAYKIGDDSRVVVIPHGNYIDIYENTINQSQARKYLNFGTDDKIFLYFGLIRPYKGVAELIEAFKRLEHPQAKLLIAGRPANSAIAEDILRKCDEHKNIRTVFEFIPDDQIQVFMNTSDIVVLPYRDILTSGAVILAMSFGKPVIAPAIGCIPDILNKDGGFLYDRSDEHGLLQAMRLALSANLVEMGKYNLQLAKRLSWDDIAKRTYDVYQKCIAKH